MIAYDISFHTYCHDVSWKDCVKQFLSSNLQQHIPAHGHDPHPTKRWHMAAPWIVMIRLASNCGSIATSTWIPKPQNRAPKRHDFLHSETVFFFGPKHSQRQNLGKFLSWEKIFDWIIELIWISSFFVGGFPKVWTMTFTFCRKKLSNPRCVSYNQPWPRYLRSIKHLWGWFLLVPARPGLWPQDVLLWKRNSRNCMKIIDDIGHDT